MTSLQKKGPFLFTATPKTLFFWAFFEIFVFQFCHLFFFLQHKKDKNRKCTFFSKPLFLTFFSKTLFWQPDKLPKIYFRTPTHYLCFSKIPKKHYKIGENKQNKILDQVLTQPWTKFDSKKTKSWTKFWLYSIYIYIHTHAVRLGSGPIFCHFGS